MPTRAIGTDWLRAYIELPNYANMLLRSGFTADDLSSVSDRVFDPIIAWGDEETVERRVNEHRVAGADHVSVQVLNAEPLVVPARNRLVGVPITAVRRSPGV